MLREKDRERALSKSDTLKRTRKKGKDTKKRERERKGKKGKQES